MWNLRSNKESYIGVDIGSSTIKVCHLRHSRQRFSLNSLGLAHLPPLSIVNGVIKQPQIIADTLRSLLSHLRITSKEIVFAISGYSVIVKKITLPLTSEKELSQSIQYEAQQHIPFDIKEVNLDFQILGPVKDDPDSMSVLLVAVKKETLGAYLEVFDLAGLETGIADVAAFALANAYEAVYALDSGPVALLNLGAGQMTLHVLGKNGPVFTRDSFLGGQQISEKIQSALKVSFQEAEKIKLTGVQSQVQLDQMARPVFSIMETWLEEIKKTLDLLSASDPESHPTKIVLSGGSSLIPDLPRFLSNGLQLPVELFNPLSLIPFDPKNIDPGYLQSVGPQCAIAFGLALRKKGER